MKALPSPVLAACGVLVFMSAGTAVAINSPATTMQANSSIVVAQADGTMTEGEIRKVDKEAKKLTIKHGEIKNLGMPAMTMVFQVKDPGMIEQVKQGDKVRFHVEQVNGAMVVTQIEPGSR